MIDPKPARTPWAPLLALVCTVLLGGCYSLSAAGPRSRAMHQGAARPASGLDIRVVDLDEAAARHILANSRSVSFLDALGDAPPALTRIDRGDVLDISIWEAPPAVLFGNVEGAYATGGAQIEHLGVPTGRAAGLPEQMVGESGEIAVPFAGRVPVVGRTPEQVQADIAVRLRNKAHDPQVLVRIARNATRDVTVVGDVAQNSRVPLTPKGERLLDILAAAGGSKQPINKTTIQITRANQVVTMPLAVVIRDPAQNIHLRPDDVVTALYQPYSFTALGAVGRNAQIDFEGTGLTLAEALGRIDGLRDDRANIKGVFILRLEDPANLDPAIVAGARTTPDGRIPVIYRANLANPATFFVAQGFQIRNKDVVYVSNAPLVDLLKFINIVASLAYTATAVGNGL